MKYQIVPLEHKHLEDAASLVSQRYAKLLQVVPLLPRQYAEIDTLLPMLAEIITASPGIAALDGKTLVGFTAGYLLPEFFGHPTVFSPEFANAARPEDYQRIYSEMYTHLAVQWIEAGYPTHIFSFLANDQPGIEVLHWLGFGMVVADALRSLEPLPAVEAAVEIRRAAAIPEDIAAVMALDTALNQHLSSSPTYFPHGAGRDRDFYTAWVSNPANAFWLAYQDGQPVALIAFGPASQEACTIIVDKGTTSIFAAYTLPAVRGTGIASSLVNCGLEWARAQGYQRCAVDFESANPEAARFWLRYFQLVGLTVMRHID